MRIKSLPTFTALALIEMLKSLKNDFMSKREANWFMAEPGEKLPISEFHKVVDYVIIFRSEKWWEAIVIFESFGKRSIGLYLWQTGMGHGKESTSLTFETSKNGTS